MINALPSRFAPSFRSAVFGAIATAALLSAPSSTLAGTKEITAVNAKLNLISQGLTIQTATDTQLASAFSAAIGDVANKRLKAGVIAGEILRGATADVGTALGNAVLAATTLDKFTVGADAIKTAGSSKFPIVVNVPDFALAITGGSQGQANIITLAVKAKASKVGVGAAIAGAAQNLTDAEKKDLVNAIFVDSKGKTLTSAALEISREVAKLTTDPATFATGVATANQKVADKVAVGTVAGQPTFAGAITTATLAIIKTGKATSLLAPKASTLAKSIGAVADIEQVQKVGEALVKVVKTSQVGTIAGTLTKAITAKSAISDNKVDEIGELAAYIITAASANIFVDQKTGDKVVLALVKSIITAAKAKLPRGSTTALPTLVPGAVNDGKNVASYLLGSVAITLKTINSTVSNAVFTTLTTTAKIKSLAKLLKITDAAFIALVNAGATETGRFENGTLAFGGALTDPETNSRNF